MSEHSQERLLAELEPTADLKVMDLVEAAGIDIRPWSLKEGNVPVANPRANPNYCYEWAFGVDDEPIVLCVWHATLQYGRDGVLYEANMRARAAELEEISFDRSASPAIKSRAKSQAKRCDRFDRRIQRAFRKSLPVRVILLVGDQADVLGHDASKVRYRRLDDKNWWVHAYDDSGHFSLVRDQIPAALRKEAAGTGETAEDEKFVDQFSVPVQRSERLVDPFSRSAEVRRRVLKRAGGHCECCGRPGFATAGGGIYLETHHVIPLYEGGEDAVFNVVAICPDDHRRAHYAADRMEVRSQLLAYLGEVTPATAIA